MENSLQEFNSAKALEDWAFKINACRNSGPTVREWCANQGIKPQILLLVEEAFHWAFATTDY